MSNWLWVCPGFPSIWKFSWIKTWTRHLSFSLSNWLKTSLKEWRDVLCQFDPVPILFGLTFLVPRVQVVGLWMASWQLSCATSGPSWSLKTLDWWIENLGFQDSQTAQDFHWISWFVLSGKMCFFPFWKPFVFFPFWKPLTWLGSFLPWLGSSCKHRSLADRISFQF